ncbi:hypothetical protein V494_07785 [Pseudogymnoascus sp. VKM F-4513 (FW-928)]|nr:hypothetical protein V494_07785 [Pseudogymnoascus sp. VKM F-4513 (FW-928)]
MRGHAGVTNEVYPSGNPGSSLFLGYGVQIYQERRNYIKIICAEITPKAEFSRIKIQTCDDQAVCNAKNVISSVIGRSRLVPVVEMLNTPQFATEAQITPLSVSASQERPLSPGNLRGVIEPSVQDDDDALPRGPEGDVGIQERRDDSHNRGGSADNNAIALQPLAECHYSHFSRHGSSHGSEFPLSPCSFPSRFDDTTARSGQCGPLSRSPFHDSNVTTSAHGLEREGEVSCSKSDTSVKKLSNNGTLRISQGPARILSDDLECKVFGFYITNAGKWVRSPGHYFQLHIPQLALVEPLVLSACLACASHIMFLLGIVEKSVEEHYNSRVLQLLIPLLSSEERATSSNDALLATTVILRMSEQFLEVGNDSQRHLNGAASLFMDGTTDWSPIESSLAIACFWTHLRETIRICFLREQPCQFDMSYLSLADDDLNPPVSSDEAWTNRMTYLLLRVCTLCWGASNETVKDDSAAIMESKRLKCLIDSWKERLPLSFRPWGVNENGNGPFPVIQCFTPWHVVAWQFYYTAKVMLAVYCTEDPYSTNLHRVGSYIELAVEPPEPSLRYTAEYFINSMNFDTRNASEKTCRGRCRSLKTSARTGKMDSYRVSLFQIRDSGSDDLCNFIARITLGFSEHGFCDFDKFLLIPSGPGSAGEALLSHSEEREDKPQQESIQQHADSSDPIAKEFHINNRQFEYAFFLVTTWNAAAAVMPMLTLPLMETYGMRIAYLAIAKNFTTLIVCYVVAEAAGGTLQNAADGVAANLFKTSKEKILPLTLYIFLLLFGVTMGPVQGVVPKTLNWRWILWIELIIYGSCIPMVFFYMKETRGSIIRSKLIGSKAFTEDSVLDGSGMSKPISPIGLLKKTIIRSAVLVTTEPVAFFFTVWSAFAFGLVFVSTQSIPLVFSNTYSWSLSNGGLVQVAIGIG